MEAETASIVDGGRPNKMNRQITQYSVNYNNRSPAIDNGSRNGIHCRRRATIIYYLLTNNIIKNNSVAHC